MMSGPIILRLMLVGLVVASSLGVVYARHQNRKLFVELQALQERRDAMNVEWGRLKLEESTWAANGRIDRIAREKLDMYIPTPEAVIVVQQKP